MKNNMIILKQMSEKLKNGIKILVGTTVLDLLIKSILNIVLIHNSRTAWPTKIVMPFLSFSDKFSSGCLYYF